ncbi:MAG: hypothetical protein HZB39_04410 [Planctomycetes bacterium]|nr:hypothetical protein [Planctomycetota bacterium]
MSEWLRLFVLTVTVEVPLAIALAPQAFKRRIALDALLANLMTHPAAWFVIGHGMLGWWPTECAVTIAEAFVFRAVTGLTWPRATVLAVAANGVTAALSFAV